MPDAGQTAKDHSIAIRAVLLALLLAAANLWSIRHLGFGLEDPIGLLGLTGGLAAFSFVLDYFISKDEQERLAQPIRSGVQTFLRTWVLATPTLIVLYLVCGIAASLFSSITVVGAASGTDVQVQIAALDDLESKTDLTVSPGQVTGPIPYVANPFGREVQIAPAGYSSRTRTLFPLTGLTLNLDEDFEPLPTLLLRPGLESLFALRSGGRYVVWRREQGNRCVELANSEGKNLGNAALLGVGRSVPAGLMPLWILELQSANLDDPTIATVLLAWQKPQPLPTTELLPGGTEIQIEIRNKSNLIGFAKLVVGTEPFQDIPVTDGQEGFQPCQ